MSTSTTQKPTTRRIVGMVVGIVIIGLGIALFKQSHLGNDSISALKCRWNNGLRVGLFRKTSLYRLFRTIKAGRSQDYRGIACCRRYRS